MVGLSAEKYEQVPLSAIPVGLELTVWYKTDAEITREAAARARWERSSDDPHVVAASLSEFLRTGTFGPIRLGMSRSAVLDTLGKPDDWSTAETPAGLPAIFKYGDIEFYFDNDDDTLICLRADNFDLLSGGEALRLDSWRLRRGTPQHEVGAQLAAQGIDSQRVIRPRDPPGMVFIKTSAGVILGFEPQPHDEAVYALESITWDAGREW